MKYIDADLLKSKLKDVATELETGNYYLDNSEQAVGYKNALIDFEQIIDSLQQKQQEEPDKSLEEAAKTNAKINMTRTKLELNEIETLTHLVRARAVEPGHFQGLYKNILSRLNKMFDEEYAGIEKKEEKK